MNRKIKKYAGYTLAVAAGMLSFLFVANSLAADTVTMCYRGRTITVPTSYQASYQALGATVGACSVSPT
jgi:hypothetical protein